MQSIIDYVRAEHARYLDELKSYLSIPSISAGDESKNDVAKCAEYTADLLRSIGMNDVKVNPTAGHPVVTGQWMVSDGRPTVLIYGHYDVQPVDPLDLWEKPPFEPHVKNDRVIARGSVDDKGQLFIHIKAVEAILKKTGGLPVNVKFLLEGEEEVGSPSLSDYLRDHKDELFADIVIISDTDMWAEGMPAITYGLKGLVFLQIELTGPNRDLHSGEHGGMVANPAEILVRMLASVKNDDGVIQIPEFYDSVIKSSDEEKVLLDKVPFDEEAYKRDLGVDEVWGEAPYSTLERGWNRPTFEINGIWSGFIGDGAKTVLPSKAFAKVSMRLVPDQNPVEIERLVRKYFADIVPKSVKMEIIRYHGGRAILVPLDNRYVKAAARALEEVFEREPYFKRTGGSIPIVADFKEILGLDTLLIGFGLPDGKAHSPNENFHIPTFYAGIETSVRLMHYIGE